MTAPFFDSNILVDAYSVDSKADIAAHLMSQPFVVGVQTLNEFVYVARRKLKMDWPATAMAVNDIESLASVVPTTELPDLRHGMNIAEKYSLAPFDALMLAIALRAGCTIFYSEDMHHGLVIDDKMTITNPFI